MPPARIALAELAPITQRRASSRFDLPQPFGPTMPVSPGSIRNSVGSTKDLKPERRRGWNCTEARALLPSALRRRGEGLGQQGEVPLAVVERAVDEEGGGAVDVLVAHRAVEPRS